MYEGKKISWAIDSHRNIFGERIFAKLMRRGLQVIESN